MDIVHTAASLWRRVPVRVQRRLMWLTHATFTVGVSAVVLDDGGRVLLLRHRFRESDAWELPGGYVGRGERLEAAIAREIREETGLEVTVQSLVAAMIGRRLHLDVCFLAQRAGGELRVADHEIIDARFFPPVDLPAVLEHERMGSIRAALRQRGVEIGGV